MLFRSEDRDPPPRSFDAGCAKVAQSFLRTALGDRKGLPFWTPNVPVNEPRPDTLELPIDKLVRFWKEPAKAFVRAQGIALPFDEGDDEALDRTPLGLNHLEEWNVQDVILQELVEAGSSIPYIKARVAADRGLPASELGNLKWEALFSVTHPLAEKVREIKTGDLVLDFLVPGTAPPVRITGRLIRGTLDQTEVLLAYSPGEFKQPKHFLQPWIQAVAAACAGSSLPSCLLDDQTLRAPAFLPRFDPSHAAELLRRLVAGYLEGQSRPLCYAPATSDVYAKSCQAWGEQPDKDALDAASDQWNDVPFNGQKGEGFSAAAQLAWRDQEPFLHDLEWHRWAAWIANPLRAWFGSR